MTRTATGISSGIAAIIVFVGAFLLAPQAGYAQEVPECDGEQETIITATGITITTCNWDLEDAPINKAAVGLAPSIGLHNACGCDFTTDNIPAKEFFKYGIKTIDCGKLDNAVFESTLIRGITKKGGEIIRFQGTAVVTNGFDDPDDLCGITVNKGRIKQGVTMMGLSEAAINSCRIDIEAYDAANLGGNC